MGTAALPFDCPSSNWLLSLPPVHQGCTHSATMALALLSHLLAARLGMLSGGHSSSSALIVRCQLSSQCTHKHQKTQCPPRLTECDPLLRPIVQGKKKNVVVALEIICDAVDRYKELCEGTHCGEHWSCVCKVPKHRQCAALLGDDARKAVPTRLLSGGLWRASAKPVSN